MQAFYGIHTRNQEDGLVVATPGQLGSRKAHVPCSFHVLRWEGVSPSNRQHRVFKEPSPKGRLKPYPYPWEESRRDAFIPPLKGVGFRLGSL